MSCDIDFSFITESCRFDSGTLQAALEELLALACSPVIPLDPNDEDCGEWGLGSTIYGVTFDPITRELAIDAAPAWGANLVSQIDSIDWDPGTDISTAATYDGAEITLSVGNISDCRQMIVVGQFANSASITYTPGKLHIMEVRDVTSGLPGVLTGDKQRRLRGAAGLELYDENIHNIPFSVIIAAGGTYNATFLARVVTTVDGSGSSGTSLWHQSILEFRGIGVLV